MVRDYSPDCPVCNVGVLWPNGWMDQDASSYECRPWSRRVRWGPYDKKHNSPHFSDHVYCGQRWQISAIAELLYVNVIRLVEEQHHVDHK